MSTHAWIARRYFFSRRRNHFLPLLTFAAIGGVTLGMISLVVVLSVMRGFSRELTKKLLGMGAHVTLLRSADAAELTHAEIMALLEKQGVENAVPFVEGEIIAQNNADEEGVAKGVRLRGVDPKALGNLSSMEYYFPNEKGSVEDLHVDPTSHLAGVIPGYQVAGDLLVHPDFDDRLRLIAPMAELSPTGEMVPRERTTRVVGIFRSGLYEYDGKVLLTTLPEAQHLLGEGARLGWQIRLMKPALAPHVATWLRLHLPGGWRVTSWNEENRKLFSALQFERIAMGAVLTLVMLIASFSIVGCVFLMTATKRKDVAILKSQGMRFGEIRRIFLFQGIWIASIGSSLGVGIGLLVCFFLAQWPVGLPASYYLDVLPVHVEFFPIMGFVLASLFMATLASIYPAVKAAGDDPCEVLRYE